jgi:tripartite-type tricarboxylate transporter receptor subunit TctC
MNARFNWTRRRLMQGMAQGLALAAIATPLAVLAQAFPSGSIKMIVPFPPAGGTDVLTRLVMQSITETAKWNFVIDNKPGAGGNIGLDAVAKSKPDGSNFGMAQTSNLAINPTLYPKMPYDALKDFVPVALVASQPTVVVVSANSPYKTLADLVNAAKGGKVMMASAGTGTVSHLGAEMFAKRAGVKWTHVPYKGAAPALNDVIAGQIDVNFATPPSALDLIRGGRLRALAVTSTERLYALPDVPTVSESGFKGFVAEDWKAVVAPAGTPPEAVKAMNAAVNAALNRGETRARLAQEGSRPQGGTPEQLASFIKSEYARWGTAVRESGATAE